MKYYCSISSLSLILLLFVLVVLNLTMLKTAEGATSATLTLNGFQKGEDGGGKSECDNQWHDDDTSVVALSTRWFKGMCGKMIAIHGNGRTAKAKVVDECDQAGGCRDDIVDASKEVWKQLGVNEGSDQYGEMHVTWELA